MLDRMNVLLLSEESEERYDRFYNSFAFATKEKFGLFIDEKGTEDLNGDKYSAKYYLSENVDSAYDSWLRKHATNAAVFSEIDTYLNRLQTNGSLANAAEMDCVTDLKTLFQHAKDLKEELAGLGKITDSLQKNNALISVENHLNALNGSEQKRGLGETLREFNKMTNLRYAKDNEFKALNLLNSQLELILLEIDQNNIEHLNVSVEARKDEQKAVEKKVEQYNQQAIQYFQDLQDMDVNGRSREDNLAIIEDKFAKIDAAMNTCKQDEKKCDKNIKNIPLKIQKEQEELTKKEQQLKKQKEKINTDRLDRLAEATAKYNNAVKHRDTLKQQLEKEKTETLLKKVRSKMDQATDEQKEWVSRIEQNNKLIKEYNGKIDNIQKGLAEFDEKIDFEKYAHDPDKKNAAYSPEDEARAKELKSAKKALYKLGGNSRYLDGTEIYSRKEIDALIESLRIDSDSDIKKLAKDGTPHTAKLSGYLDILTEYAAQYDVLHKGEKNVSISGKTRPSYARSRSVGIKAAIDLLEGLLPATKNAPVEQPLAVGLRDGINKLTAGIETAMKGNGPLYRVLKLMEEKEAYTKKNADKLSDYRAEIVRCKLAIDNAAQQITELSKTVAEEREKDEDTKEKELQAAQNEKMAKMDAEIKKADAAVKKAAEYVESYKKGVDTTLPEKCKQLSNKIEQKKTDIEKLKQNLEEAKQNKVDIQANQKELENDKKAWELRRVKEKEQYQNVANLKEECTNQLTKLDKERQRLNPSDNRISNVVKKINAFLDDVENGNVKKSDGTWDHKNGKHYTDLKTELETFKANLDNGMTLNQVAASLESLGKKAQGYLDTRGKDWSRVFSSGSHFRHARLVYATGIRNYCRMMLPFCNSTIVPLDVTKETKLTLSNVDKLCPELSMEKLDQISHNLQYDKNPALMEEKTTEQPQESIPEIAPQSLGESAEPRNEEQDTVEQERLAEMNT